MANIQVAVINACTVLTDDLIKGMQPDSRRLFTLIYAGWLPHDLVSSWSCLGLRAGT
jgi:hypothetical protein